MAGQEGLGLGRAAGGGMASAANVPSIEVNFDHGNGRNRLHAPLTPLRTNEDDERWVLSEWRSEAEGIQGEGDKSMEHFLHRPSF